MHIRGQSDKYLASWPDGASITREIYYCVVHSLRWLMSKFQIGLIVLFLPRVDAGMVADLKKKWEKTNIGW